MPASLTDCADVLAGLADEGRCVLAEAFAGYIFRATPAAVPQNPLAAADAAALAPGELELLAALRNAPSRALLSAAPLQPWLAPPLAGEAAASGIRGTSDGPPRSGTAPWPLNGAGMSTADSLASANNPALSEGLRRAPAPLVLQAQLGASLGSSGTSSTSGQSMRTTMAALQPHHAGASYVPTHAERLMQALTSASGPQPEACPPLLQTQLADWTKHGATHTLGATGELLCCGELMRAYIAASKPEHARRLLKCLLRCVSP